MQQYVKKPVVVEAWQFRPGGAENAPAWLVRALLMRKIWPDEMASEDAPKLAIQTLDSIAYADIGDWIILGVKGELYPCAADVFAETYEEAA